MISTGESYRKKTSIFSFFLRSSLSFVAWLVSTSGRLFGTHRAVPPRAIRTIIDEAWVIEDRVPVKAANW